MHTFEDRLLSALALGLVALLGWRVLTESPRRVAAVHALPSFTALALETRVARLAGAIAVAEGYFAPGRHRGRSLAHLLNNPGMLKASPLAGEEAPTWNDTGFIVFPTPRAGWVALRYQVCVMLLGASRVYDLTDTLAIVGRKYADGDANWGVNVARHLGISAAVQLQELAAGVPAMPGSPAACRGIASEPFGGADGARFDVVD